MNNYQTGRRARPVSVAVALALSAVVSPAWATGPGSYTPEVIPAPYAAPVAPAATWDGAYVGLSFGYACCGRDRVQLAPAPPGVFGTMHEHGAFVGLHAGRDWQRGSRVVGIEGSLSFGRIGDDLTVGTSSARVRINPVAELRGRVGHASGDGLLYALGGVAIGRVDYMAGDTVALSNITSSYNEAGVSVGVGYERMLADSWSMRGEYSYTLFRGRDLTDGVQTTRATPDYHAIRFGLNRRF